MTLHVTNYAAISLKELATAEAYATTIYPAAGVQTVWTDTPWAPGKKDKKIGSGDSFGRPFAEYR